MSHADRAWQGRPEPPTDAVSHDPTPAGRIVPDAPLAELVGQWCAWLASRRRTPRTIAAYRVTIERAVRACGWRTPADLTHASIIGYLSAQAWKGSTYNRNLIAFRSLTGFMARTIPDWPDPLADALCASTKDSNDGARGATLEEARAMIAEAWARERYDGRTKAARALYWLCMFQAGCRHSEPAEWKWGDLELDDGIPRVAWGGPNAPHKSGTRVEIPLHPELAALLRKHRRTLNVHKADTNRALSERVFEHQPPRHVFRKDRDRAEIPALDRRGRGFSPHSARKYFETQLVAAGAPEMVVKRLMRHAPDTTQRYFDPEFALLASWVERLPGLWPERVAGVSGNSVENNVDRKMGLTNPDQSDRFSHSTEPPLTETNNAILESGSPPASVEGTCGARSRGRAFTGSRRAAASAGKVRSTRLIDPEIMPIHGLITVDRNALADLLFAAGRLLREPGHGQGCHADDEAEDPNT